MTENALELLHQVISSPWLYLVLFALAAFDGVVPMIPGETALVTAAVFAASGTSDLTSIVLAGTAGAFVGDHTAYLVGRLALGRLTATTGSRMAAAFEWAREQLAARGGQVLLSSRYVPGVRTATTLLLGGVRYPPRRFALFDVAAALLWAGGWSVIGFLGGAVFRDRPLYGLLLGIGLAFAVTALGELGRRLWRRRTTARTGATPNSSAIPSEVSSQPDRSDLTEQHPVDSVGTPGTRHPAKPVGCRTPAGDPE